MQAYLDSVTCITEDIITENNKKRVEISEVFKRMETKEENLKTILNEIEVKKTILKEENEKLEQDVEKAMKEVEEKKSIAKTLSNELDSKSTELKLMQKEYERLSEECESSKKKSELSADDRRMLEEAKLKLQLYKEVTNVRWDYTVPQDQGVSGYVRNKNRGHCCPFNYKFDKYNQSDITERIWEHIYTAAEDWLAEEKENCPNN